VDRSANRDMNRWFGLFVTLPLAVLNDDIGMNPARVYTRPEYGFKLSPVKSVFVQVIRKTHALTSGVRWGTIFECFSHVHGVASND